MTCKWFENLRLSWLPFERLLLNYVKKYTLFLIVAGCLMVVVAVSTSCIAYLVGPVINKVFIEKQCDVLFITCAILVILYFVKTVSAYLQSMCLQIVSTRVITDIRVSAFEKIIKMPMQNFDKTESGRIITMFLRDIQNVGNNIEDVFVTSVRDFVTVLFLVVLVFWNNFTLALVSMCIYPIVFVPLKKINKSTKAIFSQGEVYLQTLSARLTDIVNGIKTIKSYNTEQLETHKIKKLLIALTRSQLKVARRKNAASPSMEFASGLSVAVVIFVGGWQIVHGYSDVGGFFSFLTALIMAHRPARSLSGFGVKLSLCAVSLQRVFVFLDEIEIEPLNQGKSIDFSHPTICFKNVDFCYAINNRVADKNGQCLVLNDVNFVIQPRQKVAFVGASGSGKSTIVSLLMRLYQCQRGDITINNENVQDLCLADLRAHIAYVGQDNFLFDDTIKHNVIYGSDNQNITDDVINNAMKKAQMSFVNELKDQVNEQVGYNGLRFSLGQRQRIAIARAIVKDAPIVIFDEATSALDAATEVAIKDIVFHDMQDKTVLIVAHRLSTVVDCDMIYVMEHGRIVERGTHASLLSSGNNGVYQSLWRNFSNNKESVE